MDSDQAEYELLVANAAKAHRRRVFLLTASAIRNPTPSETAQIAAAEASARLAHQALMAWRPDS